MKFSKWNLFNLSLSFLILLPTLSHSLCTQSQTTHLRAGPSITYPVTWSVYKNMPLRKIDEESVWIYVKDVDGDFHWVNREDVDERSCAVVKVKEVNLRTGPGNQYRLVSFFPKAEKYTTFEVLSTQGKWALLRDDDNDRYWVYRPLIWIQ